VTPSDLRGQRQPCDQRSDDRPHLTVNAGWNEHQKQRMKYRDNRDRHEGRRRSRRAEPPNDLRAEYKYVRSLLLHNSECLLRQLAALIPDLKYPNTGNHLPIIIQDVASVLGRSNHFDPIEFTVGHDLLCGRIL